MPPLSTARLLLREWRESDLAPWAALNADPEVRRHLPGMPTRPRRTHAGQGASRGKRRPGPVMGATRCQPMWG